jgi:hypothetical protein
LEKVESEIGLGHEPVPFGEREFWVAGGESGAEVVLPGLDGVLCGVASMNVWWYQLEGYRVFCESSLHEVGAFVVEDVESWGESIVS